MSYMMKIQVSKINFDIYDKNNILLWKLDLMCNVHYYLNISLVNTEKLFIYIHSQMRLRRILYETEFCLNREKKIVPAMIIVFNVC